MWGNVSSWGLQADDQALWQLHLSKEALFKCTTVVLQEHGRHRDTALCCCDWCFTFTRFTVCVSDSSVANMHIIWIIILTFVWVTTFSRSNLHHEQLHKPAATGFLSAFRHSTEVSAASFLTRSKWASDSHNLWPWTMWIQTTPHTHSWVQCDAHL